MTDVIQYVQEECGYPRFKFITEEGIERVIKKRGIRTFTHWFPYKTIFPLDLVEDAVDPVAYPGLFRIVPDDAPIEKIYDTGMVFYSGDIGLGGYPMGMGRSVYGAAGGIGGVLYGQLRANLASIIQPQHTTGEYIQPNFIQLYPKEAMRHQPGRHVHIELLLYHADDLSTIPNSYELWFLDLCALCAKHIIYEKYKDYEDDTIGGHQIRTKISEYSGSEDKIQELRDKFAEEVIRDPNRIDFFIV
jgi:hypothetical protein